MEVLLNNDGRGQKDHAEAHTFKQQNVTQDDLLNICSHVVITQFLGHVRMMSGRVDVSKDNLSNV